MRSTEKSIYTKCHLSWWRHLCTPNAHLSFIQPFLKRNFWRDNVTRLAHSNYTVPYFRLLQDVSSVMCHSWPCFDRRLASPRVLPSTCRQLAVLSFLLCPFLKTSYHHALSALTIWPLKISQNHRIMKAGKDHLVQLQTHPADHIPQRHESWTPPGMLIPAPPGQPVLMPHHHSSEGEMFPKIQPECPRVQLEANTSHPSLFYLGEKANLTLLQPPFR